MKKIIAAFTALMLLFTLCACQKNDKPNKTTISLNTPTIEIDKTFSDNIAIYMDDKLIRDDEWHTHQPTEEAQTVSEPIIGYCGNTQTTIYFDNGKSYSFMAGNSVYLTDILVNLNYDTNKLCKCLPEYKVDTEFGTGYGINLSQGYARCDKGQADLTQEQIDKIKEIILWSKDKAE